MRWIRKKGPHVAWSLLSVDSTFSHQFKTFYPNSLLNYLWTVENIRITAICHILSKTGYMVWIACVDPHYHSTNYSGQFTWPIFAQPIYSANLNAQSNTTSVGHCIDVVWFWLVNATQLMVPIIANNIFGIYKLINIKFWFIFPLLLKNNLHDAHNGSISWL